MQKDTALLDIDKTVAINLLYDFYSSLLTKRQSEIIEMYFMQDLSLTEIAEELNISRQAVRDLINRTVNILKKYEDNLLLVDRFLANSAIIDSITSKIYSLKTSVKTDDKVQSQLTDLLNEINSFNK